MNLTEFLETVITTKEGWLCMLICHKDSPLDKREEYFGWPDDKETIVKRALELAVDHNVYFSPYLFSAQDSHKEFVLPSNTIVADLDEANVLYLNPRPSVLVRTSMGRHQGYWILSDPASSIAKHEELSKRITYSIPRCDRGGWFVGKKVRLPDTNNFKYAQGAQPVEVVKVDDIRHKPIDLELLGNLNEKVVATLDLESDISWLPRAQKLASTTGPIECLARASTLLPERVLAIYDRQQSDRSRALWDLEVACVCAGATHEEIFIIANGSANNKFADLLYGADEALANDINRAFSKVAMDEPGGVKSRIDSIRYDKSSPVKKKQDMTAVVMDELNELGQFINCGDGTQWYIRDDIGRPIPIMMKGSEPLQILLDSMFGINSTEAESGYVCSALTAQVAQLQPTGVRSNLTYYDAPSHAVFLHTGRKSVLRITANNIDEVVNGHQEIIFPWNSSSDPLVPINDNSTVPWWEELFGGCFDNLTSLPKKQAMALLRAWTISVLLRNAVMTRPILALIGQPGSGKSTLCRRIYTLLYGPRKALAKVTNPNDFDMALASDPLTVFDNVDTWERWLPDRFALAAADSEITKRKLYTNTETVTMRMQGYLGVTAHNPQFGREDVADRFILLMFERLEDEARLAETDIINRLAERRNAMWGAIVQDIQKILRTPMPTDDEVPHFRVFDFAKTGLWISRALGDEDDFVKAITNMRNEQRSFSLDEEQLLVESIRNALKRERGVAGFTEGVSAAQMWQILEPATKDAQSFRLRYKNAATLGKKIWSMQDALKALFKIEWEFSPLKGTKVWRISEMEENTE